MAVVKLGWSGGKDSTCAFSLHLNQGDFVKAVCYIPMFTDDIPLITKRHYEFINNTAEFFMSQGAEVYFAKGITYWDYVTHRSVRGKFKGRIFGFPCIHRGLCGFKRDSKLKASRSIDVGYFDYECLGIAYDEFDRHSQLNEKLRSILVEKCYTEKFCHHYCYLNGLLSPHYDYSSRDGCVLCPNAKEIERRIWYNDYPLSRPLLIDLQNFVKSERSDCFPLRDFQWFINTDIQYSFFD